MSDGLAGRGAGLGVGSSGFVATHGLHTTPSATPPARSPRGSGSRAAHRAADRRRPARHPARRRTCPATRAVSAMRNGSDFSGAIYSLDTGNCVFPPAFAAGGGFGIDEMTGLPRRRRSCPTRPRSGCCRGPTAPAGCCATSYFANGKPMPLDGRGLLRRQLDRLAERGLELYCRHRGRVLRDAAASNASDRVRRDRAAGRAGQAPAVERRSSAATSSCPRAAWTASPARSRRSATGSSDVGLPPRSIEDEWGPGQIEFTFSPIEGLAAADAMVLFRCAVKAICARRGLLATFMCWPALPNFFSSGWHLHQSLVERRRRPERRSWTTPSCCRRWAAQFVAGLLDHAREMARVRRPDDQRVRALPPVLVRARPDLLGGRQPRRADPRPGRSRRRRHARREPASASRPRTRTCGSPRTSRPGLDGIDRGADAAAAVEGDPYAEPRRRCCRSRSARRSTRSSAATLYREAFGDPLVDYLVMMKRAEVGRYDEAAGDGPRPARSDWEMREYFEIY